MIRGPGGALLSRVRISDGIEGEAVLLSTAMKLVALTDVHIILVVCSRYCRGFHGSAFTADPQGWSVLELNGICEITRGAIDTWRLVRGLSFGIMSV
jgi:hypothetical protein